jgi:hypothetical protein
VNTSGEGQLFCPSLYFSPQARAVNKEELFNLWHACVCNVIEHILGILKQCFIILMHPPKYTMHIQAHIPPTLGAIHNFICIYDPGKINDFTYEDFNFNINDGQAGGLALGPANVTERTQVALKHNQIAQDMWGDYQGILLGHGLALEY